MKSVLPFVLATRTIAATAPKPAQFLARRDYNPGRLEVGRAILPAGALSSARKLAESRLAANAGCPTKMEQLFLERP